MLTKFGHFFSSTALDAVTDHAPRQWIAIKPGCCQSCLSNVSLTVEARMATWLMAAISDQIAAEMLSSLVVVLGDVGNSMTPPREMVFGRPKSRSSWPTLSEPRHINVDFTFNRWSFFDACR